MKSLSVSITGTTGFLGWHIAEACVARGWDVRAIVRPSNRKPVPAGVTTVEADLVSSEMSKACEGADVIVHSAAVVRAPNEAVFHQVNVEGTRAAVAAAERAGSRLLLVSSQAAAGPGTVDAPRREHDVPAPVNAYGRSKLASEAVVRAAAGVRWSILRPCAVYGPRDLGFLPLFKLARRGLFLLPSASATYFTLIEVSDLVRAVLIAIERESAIGETVFVGHPVPRTSADVLRAIAAAEQRAFSPARVPAAAFSALAAVGDLCWRLGVKPPVDSGRLQELRAAGFVCSVERARRLLDFEASTPLEEGIARTAAWYREHGWV